MSFKVLQFNPQASTNIRRRVPPHDGRGRTQATLLDMGFVHSWFELDDFDDAPSSQGINWGAISGLALSVAISLTFWVGLVRIVSHVWK